jgi:hypothetical protein
MAATTPLTTHTSITHSRASSGDADYHRLSSDTLPIKSSSDSRVVRMSCNSTSDINDMTNAYNAQHQFLTPSRGTVKRSRRRDSATKAWHHGIGGAGNQAGLLNESKMSDALSDASSETLYMPPAPRSRADILKTRLGRHLAARNARATFFEERRWKLATPAVGGVFEDEKSRSSNLSISKPDPPPFE